MRFPPRGSLLCLSIRVKGLRAVWSGGGAGWTFAWAGFCAVVQQVLHLLELSLGRCLRHLAGCLHRPAILPPVSRPEGCEGGYFCPKIHAEHALKAHLPRKEGRGSGFSLFFTYICLSYEESIKR